MLRPIIFAISNNKTITRFLSRKGMSTGFAKRFVAGEELRDAIRLVREFNRKDITATLNFLGEHVNDRIKAESVTQTYCQILDTLEGEKVDCNLSVKLTQMGLDIDNEFCWSNLQKVLDTARRHDIFVRLDMESSAYTDRTLDLHRRARAVHSKVGTVIQTALYRSEQDIRDLNAMHSPVRLVKGAYLEPKSIAFQAKADVDDNFRKLTALLLREGVYPALATQDPNMIDHAREFAAKHSIPQSAYEFQMILGVRRDLQESLRRQGYNVRVYIPFGKEWLPYFMRRIAERPANMFFVLRNLLRR